MVLGIYIYIFFKEEFPDELRIATASYSDDVGFKAAPSLDNTSTPCCEKFIIPRSRERFAVLKRRLVVVITY